MVYQTVRQNEVFIIIQFFVPQVLVDAHYSFVESQRSLKEIRL